MTVRCVVADDQAMVREGFSALLDAQSGIEVVGQAEDGVEAVVVARNTAPDVVLMDIRMPELDGITATRQILEESGPERPRIVILTTFGLDEYVYDALRAGASGFLLKDARADELVQAVRVVATGEALLAPSITRRLIAEFVRRAPVVGRSPGILSTLSRRETEVLTLVARGLSNVEISRELFIAEQTAKTHVSHVLMKLNARDRAQAVIAAYEAGLVVPGE
jgi:DNA-binding NarL/FixJ family response regulator